MCYKCYWVLLVMMPCVVILNAVKNLEVSVAVDGSTSLEILRYTQDDIVSEPTYPYPKNHKITKSHYHRGWGYVISCDSAADVSRRFRGISCQSGADVVLT